MSLINILKKYSFNIEDQAGNKLVVVEESDFENIQNEVEMRSEQLSCGRNITSCVFYKDGGKCSNLEYCRDQTT